MTELPWAVSFGARDLNRASSGIVDFLTFSTVTLHDFFFLVPIGSNSLYRFVIMLASVCVGREYQLRQCLEKGRS
jgi:hypothetical protein